MECVWKKEFKNSEKNLPNKMAKEFCNQLYDATNKKVMAKVEKYKTTIKDMSPKSSFDMIGSISPFFNSTTEQTFLGEVEGKSVFTYELYITGDKTPNYKYRFCFIEYGISGYPVKIAIDSEISKELEISNIISCSNEKEYKDVLIKILNSNKLTDVIESLMSIN